MSACVRERERERERAGESEEVKKVMEKRRGGKGRKETGVFVSERACERERECVCVCVCVCVRVRVAEEG